MKLSRRDALFILAGGEVVALTTLDGDPAPDEKGAISDRQVGTLVKVSEVLYVRLREQRRNEHLSRDREHERKADQLTDKLVDEI